MYLINNFATVHPNSSISETVRNRTHVHINFFLTTADTMISQNIDLSSSDTLCNVCIAHPSAYVKDSDLRQVTHQSTGTLQDDKDRKCSDLINNPAMSPKRGLTPRRVDSRPPVMQSVADWVRKYWLPGDKGGPPTTIRLSFNFYNK
jgi:hypothetical protein